MSAAPTFDEARGTNRCDDFSALLAPLGTAAFFRDHYEKKPLHLSGRTVSAPLLTGAAMLEALIDGRWTGTRLLLNPRAWGSGEGVPDLLALSREERAARLTRYVEDGYPLMWNAGRAASPAVARLGAQFSEVFGARVWPNLYWTGHAGTPLPFHFDAHEVLAVQCEGRKTWQISALRVDTPLDAPDMAQAVREAMEAGREAAQANLAMEFTAEPGDVVYIPRGQFHNAFTPEGRSLHVTFAIEPPSGYDLLQDLAAQALADPLLRTYLPPPGEKLDAAHLARLRTALHALLDDEVLERALETQRGARISGSRAPP